MHTILDSTSHIHRTRAFDVVNGSRVYRCSQFRGQILVKKLKYVSYCFYLLTAHGQETVVTSFLFSFY